MKMKIEQDTHLFKSPDSNPQRILEKVAGFYQRSLNNNPAAKETIKSFGINEQTIAQYRLGFSDGALVKAIPETGPIADCLKQAGVLDEQGKEVFFDCLIIPELDAHGSCVQIRGKKLAEVTEKDLSAILPNEQAIADDGCVEQVKEGLFIRWAERKYLIRGIDNSNQRQLKVNIKAVNQTKFHIDSFDLYIAKQRKNFAKEAAVLFHAQAETVEDDLNRIIEHSERYLHSKTADAKKEYQMSDKEREEALRFLKSPDIIEQILDDFSAIGCCGEKTNKLIGYLAAVSRKLDDPISLLILSRSAAGKSTLQDAILEFVPEGDKVKYTRITGQALFYKGEHSLSHKVMGIEEEEGASQAAYSIRTMQSSKYLTIATTIKDPLTGQMKTVEYHVQGPLAIIITTTHSDIDYETASRFIVLTIDESRTQTQQIHKIQREADTLTGLLRDSKRDEVIKKHHNAQRLLRPLKVVNPYADVLSFADDRLRLRRDHKKYLNLIKAIAFLHQYQRQVKQIKQQDKVIEYIEVSIDDIIFANRLSDEIFGRSLDELAPGSRELLFLIREMIKKMAQVQGIAESKLRFSRRDVREYTKWSDHQIRDHLEQLVGLEYIAVSSGKNGSRIFYELLYDGRGENGEKFYMGLADIKSLRERIKSVDLAHKKADFAPTLRPACARLAPTLR